MSGFLLYDLNGIAIPMDIRQFQVDNIDGSQSRSERRATEWHDCVFPKVVQSSARSIFCSSSRVIVGIIEVFLPRLLGTESLRHNSVRCLLSTNLGMNGELTKPFSYWLADIVLKQMGERD